MANSRPAGCFIGQLFSIFVCVPLALAAACVFNPGLSARPSTTTIGARLASVVAVIPVVVGRPQNLEEPEGSGVVVGSGDRVLTADHIIGSATRVRIRTLDGLVADAEIIGRDSDTDLALLKIPFDLPPLSFAEYPAVGDETCAVGNAFGLGMSVTCGTVSAVRRAGIGFNEIEDFVQTDASVNPGMSGGALIDTKGNLIGILSAIFTKRSDANIGVNFAVSAPLARLSLDRFQTDNPQPWRRAGLRLRQFPPTGGTGRSGAVIVDVVPDSAASSAGFRVGDIVVRAGDRRIMGPADLRTAIAMQPSGSTMKILAVREDSDVTIDLVVDPQH